MPLTWLITPMSLVLRRWAIVWLPAQFLLRLEPLRAARPAPALTSTWMPTMDLHSCLALQPAPTATSFTHPDSFNWAPVSSSKRVLSSTRRGSFGCRVFVCKSSNWQMAEMQLLAPSYWLWAKTKDNGARRHPALRRCIATSQSLNAGEFQGHSQVEPVQATYCR